MSSLLRCSVVIPTYNCLEYLRSALMSVAMQALDEVEAIVVDDGSTDGTGEWLDQYCKHTPWVRLLRMPGSSGPAKARNAALSAARGRFIAFLVADDLWWPGKLKRQLEHHEENLDVAFSFTDYLHYDPEGRLHGTCFEFWKPTYISRADGQYRTAPDAEFELLAANVVGTSAVVASARALQNANGFPVDSQSAEDWSLWLQMAASGRVTCSAAVTMSYLMRPASETSNRLARINAMRETVAPYAGRKEALAKYAYRRASARIHTAEAEYHSLRGSPWRSTRSFAGAFLSWPDVRTARAIAANFGKMLLPDERR